MDDEGGGILSLFSGSALVFFSLARAVLKARLFIYI